MATSNFIDTATIWLHAGKGGDGAVTAGAAATSSLWPMTTCPP